MSNLEFLGLTVAEILGGSRNFKIGSRDSNMTPFDPILHFLLEVTAVSLHAKFDVSGFNHLRDIRGVPKF